MFRYIFAGGKFVYQILVQIASESIIDIHYTCFRLIESGIVDKSFLAVILAVVKYEKEYTIRLSEDEEKAIEFISKKLASGKRIHELELLKRTLQYPWNHWASAEAFIREVSL